MLALVNITSSSFPKGPRSLLSENLPEAVHQAAVGGLTGPRRHLQPGLDHVSRGHQRGRWHAWGAESKSRSVLSHFAFLCLILNRAESFKSEPNK